MKEIIEVFQEAGLPNVASYWETRVVDREIIASLQGRAESFELGGVASPLVVFSIFVYDLGSKSLNQQLLVSLVDLAQCKEILATLKRRFPGDVSPENTAALFIVDRHFSQKDHGSRINQPAITYAEAILVLRLNRDGEAT